MTRTLHIPAETLHAALLIAQAVEAGRVPMVAHYGSEEAAEAWAALLSEVHRRPVRVFAIVLEGRAARPPRMAARFIDSAGSLAAALMLVIGGAYAVGFGSVLS